MNMSAKKNEILAAQLFFDDTFLSYGMEDNEFGYRASLNGFNSSFKILTSKSNQVENLQENTSEKSSLPNDETPPSNDLDDEIPF